MEEDELMMMSIRSHDQFNTTIYGSTIATVEFLMSGG
jgi:hypothetical protein